MSREDFYRLFRETGEPLYWLLSRRRGGEGSRERERCGKGAERGK